MTGSGPGFAPADFTLAFSVSATGDAFTGTGVALDAGLDRLDIILAATSPSGGAVGNLVLASLSFQTPLAEDPFALTALFDPAVGFGTVTVTNVKAVPLPAGAALWLTACTMLALRRRRAQIGGNRRRRGGAKRLAGCSDGGRIQEARPALPGVAMFAAAYARAPFRRTAARVPSDARISQTLAGAGTDAVAAGADPMPK